MAQLDEEDLIEREQSEDALAEQQRQEWEAQQQQERLARIRQQSAETRVEKSADTVQKTQKWVKRYQKTAVVFEFLGASFPIWGPILGVLIAAMFIIIVLITGCSQTGLSGSVARGVSKVAGVFSTDVCKNLAFNGGRSGGAGSGASFGGKLTDAEARAQLAAAGITVNALEPQTSLEGISQAVITEIINFAVSCSRSVNPNAGLSSNICGVVFTGGTETNAGHAGGPCSHLSGNKADIRVTTAVNSYIQNPLNFTKIQTRSDGAAQYRNNATGVIYALESDHWDIGGVGC